MFSNIPRPKLKGVVRAEMKYYAILVEVDEKKPALVNLTMILNYNLKGSLPSWMRVRILHFSTHVCSTIATRLSTNHSSNSRRQLRTYRRVFIHNFVNQCTYKSHQYKV